MKDIIDKTPACPFRVGDRVRFVPIRYHFDTKPHRFSGRWGGMQGNRSHHQLTVYDIRVPGSHTNIRIPSGPRKPWGDHLP